MRVVSRLSGGVSGGMIVGSRRASIVLPVPGLPMKSMIWTNPPEARTLLLSPREVRHDPSAPRDAATCAPGLQLHPLFPPRPGEGRQSPPPNRNARLLARPQQGEAGFVPYTGG